MRGSLRTRLFAAIVLVVFCSGALPLALGAVLTRQQVERATVADIAHQADLLAERERSALLPCVHLSALRPFLERQHGRVECLPRGSRWEGPLEGTDGGHYYAARTVGNRVLVLERPKHDDWTPFLWS